MIELSRLHGVGSVVINADLIELIESCPDTTITLVTRRKFVVGDSLDTVISKIIAYRRAAYGALPVTTDRPEFHEVESAESATLREAA